MGIAWAVFSLLFGLESGGAGLRGLAAWSIPVAVACLALGSIVPTGRGFRSLAVLAALIAVALLPPARRGDWVPLRLTGAFVLCLLGTLAAGCGGSPAFPLGLAAGFGACAAGIAGLLGAAVTVVLAPVLVLSGAAVRAMGRRGEGTTKWRPARPTLTAPRLLLAAATGGAAALVVRAYLPDSLSLAYASADLGVAALLGMAAALWVFGRLRATAGLLAVCTVAVVAVALMAGFSFFMYPDLVLSEPAALQTSGTLLGPGRTFPLYAFAFLLGAWGGVGWSHEGWRPGPMLATLSAAVGFGLIGAVHGQAALGPVMVAVAGLGGLAALCISVAPGGSRVEALPIAGAVLVLAGGVWACLADPQLDWMGLREGLSKRVMLRTELESGRTPMAVESTLSAEGLRASVTVGAPAHTAEIFNGALGLLRSPSGPVESRGLALTVALPLAFAGPEAAVAVVSPKPDATWQRTEAAGGMAPRGIQAEGQASKERFDVVVCGPGPFWALRNPLSVLSVEGLMRLRSRLAADGLLALWFPLGQVDLLTLRRALATVAEVFPGFTVFVSGPDAVFVCGPGRTVGYDSLERVTEAMPEDGFWHPLDLMGAYAADAAELAYLFEGVAPYTNRRPCRPPALGRDLDATRGRTATAAVLRHRLSGPGRVLARVRFRSEGQAQVAGRAFRALYVGRTRALLTGLGTGQTKLPEDLVDLLSGPLARLDLFAPDEEEPAVRRAAAYAIFGMKAAAAQILQEAVVRGEDSFAVRVYLGSVLETLDRADEALIQYESALIFRPADNAVRGRMALLLERAGQAQGAARVLRQALEHEPENVAALLMLGKLCAGPLRLYDEAERLALRVLELAPENTVAAQLLQIARRRADGPSGR